LVRSLGADAVIDYTRDDFSKAGPIYDIVHDTVDKSGFWRSLRALKRGGAYVMIGPGLVPLSGGLWAKVTGAGKVIGIMPRFGVTELDYLKELVERAKFRPVIDRHYPLTQIAEAHRYAQAGHKKGNVVIDVAPESQG
jgi:NADPH:quinone reductase-like Zn-dependent oxidoreductase